MLSFLQEHESLLFLLGLLSLGTFFLTMAIILWILIKLPVDYFAKPRRVSLVSKDAHPSIRMLILLIKNVVGTAIVLIGIMMLVLPGQGLLTMLLGLVLVDFPRKYKLQRWLISRGPVLKSANWLREKAGRESLEVGE